MADPRPDERLRYVMRVASHLLPAPGGEVVRELLGHLDGAEAEVASLRADVEKWRHLLADAEVERNGAIEEARIDRARVRELEGFVSRLKTGGCWCGLGINDPRTRGQHSELCQEITASLSQQPCSVCGGSGRVITDTGATFEEQLCCPPITGPCPHCNGSGVEPKEEA